VNRGQSSNDLIPSAIHIAAAANGAAEGYALDPAGVTVKR